MPSLRYRRVTTGCNAATRSAVAPRLLENLKKHFSCKVKGQSLGMCVSPKLYQMKPYKIPYESPFFMLQDGGIDITKQSSMGKL